MSTLLYPIFYFYSLWPTDPIERIRWLADSNRTATVAAAKLDWLEAHLPDDYKVEWAGIPHSQRLGSSDELDLRIKNIYGPQSDPLSYVVWVRISDPLAQTLWEEGTREIY